MIAADAQSEIGSYYLERFRSNLGALNAIKSGILVMPNREFTPEQFRKTLSYGIYALYNELKGFGYGRQAGEIAEEYIRSYETNLD